MNLHFRDPARYPGQFMSHPDPTPERLANRKAGTDLLHEAASRGNKIALHTESLMGIAAMSGFYVNEAVDYADDDDGWYDVRPY